MSTIDQKDLTLSLLAILSRDSQKELISNIL